MGFGRRGGLIHGPMQRRTFAKALQCHILVLILPPVPTIDDENSGMVVRFVNDLFLLQQPRNYDVFKDSVRSLNVGPVIVRLHKVPNPLTL